MSHVYLIHFDRPYRHARHYIGYTENLEQRLEAHRAGHGSRLIQVVREHGIGWRVARTWDRGRDYERVLKRVGHASRYCPICKNDRRGNQ